MIATRGKALVRGTGFGVGDDGDAQFTISKAHEHAVCYAKTAKPRNADEAPTIVESDIAPTLGTHDISEARQNQYVLYCGYPEKDNDDESESI